MGNSLECTWIRQTECWRNCNHGCLFCCGCSCETQCCQNGCCNCFSGENDCGLCSWENLECNPCLLREYSNEYLTQVLNEFDFIQTYEDKNFKEIYLLEHRLGKEYIILKIIEENNEKEHQALNDLFNQRLDLQHPNIVQLRKEELFTILKSVLEGLKFLKEHNINHNCLKLDRIFQSGPQHYKIADPALFNNQPFYSQIYFDREYSTSGLYLSPNELLALRKGEEHPIHNKEKTDVFMLGMIMLQIASLSNVDSCYDYIHGTLFLDKIQQKLEVVKAKYHDSLFFIIQEMLIEKEIDRPNLDILLEKLNRNHRVKSGNQNLNQTQFKAEKSNIKSMAVNDKTIKPLPMNNEVSRIQGLDQTKFQNKQDNDQSLQQQNQSFQNNPNTSALYQLDPAIQEILNRDNNYNNYNYNNINLNKSNLNNMDYGNIGNLGNYGNYGNYDLGLANNYGLNDMSSLGMGGNYNFGGLNLGLNNNNYNNISNNLYSGNNLGLGTVSKAGGGLYTGGGDKSFSSLGGMGGFKSGAGQISKGFVKFEDEDEDEIGLTKKKKQGNTVYERYNNGSKYEGQKQGGLRHGYGKYQYATGGIYEGYWKQNKMHGKGILYFRDGITAYDGEFKDDQMDGHGTLYNEYPDRGNVNINPKNVNQLLLQNKWIKYEGDFCKGKKQGFGNIYFANGDKYVGGFSNDQPNGQGTYYRANGQIAAQGIWKDGILQ
ncbi:Protein kinase-like domain [Pseudocohnilembus persalinus]|uniref:Protein kinase-like domain n=1 Tax=Pseudocohnilembus persalinus TaxID=266149 RepID=A0A0V0QZB4_PSEPJ|nr:Protein kinase-like domain [Pseudocohnilembus persalinus]|eukprot:KRX07582.1 Protein kinase-like domain [Pseudocohnilembus persalinus]